MIGKLEKALAPCGDVGLLVLRVAIGVIFIAHGAQKLFGWFGGPGLGPMGEGFAMMGFTPGLFWAAVVGITEFAGGLAVLVGFLTRPAALFLAITMTVAMIKVHLPNGFFLNFGLTPGVGHGIEYNVALVGSSLALFFCGAGKFSLGCAACQSPEKSQ